MPTKIEWVKNPDGTAGETWNPIRARNLETGGVGHFCVHVSPGCEFCYAEGFQKRFNNPIRYAAQDASKVELFLDEKVLHKPLSWRKPRTVFVCSMTDLFLENTPAEWIDQVFAVMALAPHHRFQVLTKRAARMQAYITSRPPSRGISGGMVVLAHDPQSADPFPMTIRVAWPLPNVWLGVSVEDQKRADERIPILLNTPAAMRFISAEPLLGPIDVPDCEWFGEGLIEWVICGGESGPNARPMNPDWARYLRDQCTFEGAAFFLKQMGEWADVSLSNCLKGDRWVGSGMGSPATHMRRIGKKRAGRLLDGRTWEEMPYG